LHYENNGIDFFVDNAKENPRTDLEQIQNRNIHVSIDDFGTGYSSLSQLPNLAS